MGKRKKKVTPKSKSKDKNVSISDSPLSSTIYSSPQHSEGDMSDIFLNLSGLNLSDVGRMEAKVIFSRGRGKNNSPSMIYVTSRSMEMLGVLPGDRIILYVVVENGGTVSIAGECGNHEHKKANAVLLPSIWGWLKDDISTATLFKTSSPHVPPPIVPILSMNIKFPTPFSPSHHSHLISILHTQISGVCLSKIIHHKEEERKEEEEDSHHHKWPKFTIKIQSASYEVEIMEIVGDGVVCWDDLSKKEEKEEIESPPRTTSPPLFYQVTPSTSIFLSHDNQQQMDSDAIVDMDRIVFAR